VGEAVLLHESDPGQASLRVARSEKGPPIRLQRVNERQGGLRPRKEEILQRVSLLGAQLADHPISVSPPAFAGRRPPRWSDPREDGSHLAGSPAGSPSKGRAVHELANAF